MRVEDNILLEGKSNELYDYLIQHKSRIIQAKKSEIIKSAPLAVNTLQYQKHKPATSVKSKPEGEKADPITDPDGVYVEVVANTTNFCDSYMDVLVRGAYDNTIQKHSTRMVHLHDHIYKRTAIVGDVKKVKAEDISLSQLGVQGMLGETQALIFGSEVRKEYNPSIFYQYKRNKVGQHSIGFRYVKLSLAIMNPDYEEEFAVWEKYYNNIINKDLVEKRGYFWAVEEVEIYENSAVIIGANELTPTLSVEQIKSGLSIDELKEGAELLDGKQKEEKNPEPEVNINLLRLQQY